MKIKFKWGTEGNEAFEKPKASITSESILQPNKTNRYESGSLLPRRALMRVIPEQTGGGLQPVHFISCITTDTDRNATAPTV